MKVSRALIWSIIHNKKHPLMEKKYAQIIGLMPLVTKLFPGINFYSISGFGQVMEECVVPALKKRFPDVQAMSEGEIKTTAKVLVTEFLPSKGYEWQTSKRWRTRFNKLLAA
jgi:hypothetical protein